MFAEIITPITENWSNTKFFTSSKFEITFIGFISLLNSKLGKNEGKISTDSESFDTIGFKLVISTCTVFSLPARHLQAIDMMLLSLSTCTVV